MSKFRVGDKVELVNHDGAIASGIEIGAELTILELINVSYISKLQYRVGYTTVYGEHMNNGYVSDKHIKPIKSNTTITELVLDEDKNLIKQLRKDVGYLTGRVKTLSEQVLELSTIIKKMNDTKLKEDEVKTNTVELNLLINRAHAIKKAKKFVDEYKGDNDKRFNDGSGDIIYYTEFIVNKDKRTVVALIKGSFTGCVYSKGVAKCLPEDVWNEDIGKAIALSRGLKLTDVESEFINVVNPDKVVVGQIVKSKYNPNTTWKVYSIKGDTGTLIVTYSEVKSIIGEKIECDGLTVDDWVIIYDDTEVKY